MTAELKLDADLTFSVSNPPMGDHPETVVDGRITADGSHVEVTVDSTAAVSPGMSLRRASSVGRVVARGLADRGLTVSLSGPDGRIVTLGAVRSGFVQRLATRSRHVRVDDWNAARRLVRRQTQGGPGLSLAELVPPSTLWPPAPTFRRRPRRRITTTHDPLGGGDPRLVFSVGWAPVAGMTRRVFYLVRGTTRIGSAPDCDLVLPGLRSHHAEIRRGDHDDEYYLVSVDGAAPTTVNGQQVDRAGGEDVEKQRLRTGSRVTVGPWTMAYAREEYADHGRPFGGRQGGELSRQRPQDRPTYRG